MDLFAQAKAQGIQTEFLDGQGHRRVTDAAALKIILDALPPQAPGPLVGHPVVVRSGRPSGTELPATAKLPVAWKIVADSGVIANGESSDHAIDWPRDLPLGVYRLQVSDATTAEDVPLISAPERAFGGEFDRCWLLAVQLYGVRSARNWGMGDFTDLAGLIELADRLGADGVGLNPLHALFDDRPGDCSPYSPNSRLFLNALYIDVEKLPEFQPDAEIREALASLRAGDVVDYVGVAGLKWQALRTPNRAATRILTNSAPSAAPCCRILPASRCSGTNSASRGGNGRRNGGSRTTLNVPRCARARMPARSNSSNSCNGPPTGS